MSHCAQVWDPLTGKLKKDLLYQVEEHFMMHDSAVLALAFSRDSDVLASASQDGRIKARSLLSICKSSSALSTARCWRSPSPATPRSSPWPPRTAGSSQVTGGLDTIALPICIGLAFQDRQ